MPKNPNPTLHAPYAKHYTPNQTPYSTPHLNPKRLPRVAPTRRLLMLLPTMMSGSEELRAKIPGYSPPAFEAQETNGGAA
jgi:hypothetical protein